MADLRREISFWSELAWLERCHALLACRLLAPSSATAVSEPKGGGVSPTASYNIQPSSVPNYDTCPSSARSRHYLRAYHILQQRIQSDDIALKFVPDCENASDVLTKWVDRGKFERCVAYLTGERASPA